VEELVPIGEVREQIQDIFTQRKIYVLKSRRMRWAGHVTRMGENRNAYRIFVACQKERDHSEDQDVGGWTILKWILES
jgi:hypothetical protein